jgi:hypothetical protein
MTCMIDGEDLLQREAYFAKCWKAKGTSIIGPAVWYKLKGYSDQMMRCKWAASIVGLVVGQ